MIMNEKDLNRWKEKVVNLLKNNDLILESKNFTSLQVAHLLNKDCLIKNKSMASFTTIWMFENYIIPILDWLIEDWKIKKLWDDIYNLV